MNIQLSLRVQHKLELRNISKQDVAECFSNIPYDYHFLKDERGEHNTIPPTWWFISRTKEGRQLKVCFLVHLMSETIYIKTAYDVNQACLKWYINRLKPIKGS